VIRALAPDRVLPWWRYIGPWPIRPLIVALFGASFFAFTASATVLVQPDLTTDVTPLTQFISVLLGSIIVWATLSLGRRWQERHGMGLFVYLSLTMVSSLAALSVRSYVGGVAEIVFDSPGALALSVLRLWIPVLAINSIVGATTARLEAQVQQTTAALAVTRVQQDWMLEADERARRQVADTLHDQVQAALIAACLHLQTVEPSDRAAIDAVIGRLEHLRKVDVRRAARALSPTLSEVGLASSLAELGSQYEPGMLTFVKVSPQIDGAGSRVDERTRLGCYRIVEQALLNSAVHGGARNCHVNVECTVEGILVTVIDDGAGFRGIDPQAGSGSALISTWARTLDGTWSWDEPDSGGVRLLVHLPHHMCD